MTARLARLSGLDASFLYAETETRPLHVACVLVLDPSEVGGPDPTGRIVARLVQRMQALPAFRRRPRALPLGLGHPVWIESTKVEAKAHVRRRVLPAPGDDRTLAEAVARVAERRLDRRRPLWELVALEGLEGGRVALVMKVHHALVDGSAGVGLLAHLFDTDPGQADRALPPPEPAPAPGEGALWREALRAVAARPAQVARVVADARRAVRGLAALAASSSDERAPTLPLPAPPVPWSRTLSAHRRVAFGQASLGRARAAAAAAGVKVNDVVLAACTVALRGVLEAQGALPERPLVASVPVAVGEGFGSNRVSSLFARLPVQLADPRAVLRAVREDTQRAKQLHAAWGGRTLMDLAELASPLVVPLGARLYEMLRLAERHPPVHNLIVSNVPGPPFPLFLGGARLVAAHPLGPVLEGAALNVSVLSHEEVLDFGVIACRAALPDLRPLAEGFGAAVDRLAEAAEARPARRRRPAPAAC